MASGSGTRSSPARRDLYHITVDTEGLFHHNCRGLDQRCAFRSLAEVLAALRLRIKLRLKPGSRMLPGAEAYGKFFPLVGDSESLPPPAPWSSWKYCLSLKDGFFHVHLSDVNAPPDIGGPFQDLGEALAAIGRHRSFFSTPPPTAVDASLNPPPADEAPSNPPPVDEEDWMKEQREKGRALKLKLSQLNPDDVLRSVRSTLKRMSNDAQMYTKPKQPVEKSWMDTIIEKLTPTTTDPDILKARYRFERLVEERETIKNGMKWMRKEVLQAFKSYISSAGYNKNFEYDFVRLDFQCLIYGTSSKSYHHYNFTMRTRLSRSKPWTYQRFFAEVKPTKNEPKYFCCPLQPSEDGHCFGCRKVGISLRHPDGGGYEKGHPGCGFPFDTDSESDDL